MNQVNPFSCGYLIGLVGWCIACLAILRAIGVPDSFAGPFALVTTIRLFALGIIAVIWQLVDRGQTLTFQDSGLPSALWDLSRVKLDDQDWAGYIFLHRRFANYHRRPGTVHKVATAIAYKRDVLALINERDEHEIIIDPDRCHYQD